MPVHPSRALGRFTRSVPVGSQTASCLRMRHSCPEASATEITHMPMPRQTVRISAPEYNVMVRLKSMLSKAFRLEHTECEAPLSRIQWSARSASCSIGASNRSPPHRLGMFRPCGHLVESCIGSCSSRCTPAIIRRASTLDRCARSSPLHGLDILSRRIAGWLSRFGLQRPLNGWHCAFCLVSQISCIFMPTCS